MTSTPSNPAPIGHTEAVAEHLLTTAEAARRLGFAPSTLNKWRITGRGPSFLKLGRSVRYSLSDLDAFLSAPNCKSSKSQGISS